MLPNEIHKKKNSTRKGVEFLILTATTTWLDSNGRVCRSSFDKPTKNFVSVEKFEELSQEACWEKDFFFIKRKNQIKCLTFWQLPVTGMTLAESV